MTTVKSEIAVFSAANGALAVCGPQDMPLRTGQLSVALPADYNEETYEWSATARGMIETAPRVKRYLIVRIKEEAEQRKMALFTAGGAKKTEYAEKRQEVISYDSLASGIGGLVAQLTSLSTARRQVMFAHATADAAAHGDTIAAAIERFRQGMAGSVSTVTLAAIEAATCKKVRDATTPAQAWAIYNAMKWN